MLIKFIGGDEREIADLRGADLRGANLRGADLREADLREADLWEADLWGANLWEADLWEAVGIIVFDNIAEWGRLCICSQTHVHVGCRWFTKDEALAYWAEKPHRAKTLAIVEFCAAQGLLK